MTRTYTDPGWQEVYADVNLVYGGFWIKDYGDYAEWAEVTDLDGAAGAQELVMIETGSIGLYSGSISEEVSRLRSALTSCGPGVKEYLAMPHEYRRDVAWGSLRHCCGGDTDTAQIVCTELEPDDHVRHTWDGWDKNGQGELAYVDGERGLRQYLYDNYLLPTTDEDGA